MAWPHVRRPLHRPQAAQGSSRCVVTVPGSALQGSFMFAKLCSGIGQNLRRPVCVTYRLSLSLSPSLYPSSVCLSTSQIYLH